MRFGWLIATILLGLSSISNALADEYGSKYFQQLGGWTISSWDDGECIAFNRPGEEFKVAPFNALWIVRGPGENEAAIEVFFWPGAFRKDERATLSVSDGRGLNVTYQAIAVEDYAIRTSEPVNYADIVRFARGSLLHVNTPKVSRELVFDIERLQRVLAHIDACFDRVRP